MKQVRARALALVLALCVMVGVWPAVTTTAKAANSNTSEATAIRVTNGQTVNVTIQPGEALFYAVTANKAGQFLQATATTVDVNMWFFDPSETDDKGLGMDSIRYDNSVVAMAPAAGSYYLQINGARLSSAVTFSFTVTVTDNDAYESNDLMSIAAEIQPGETVDFVWSQIDSDWFKIVTTKPGQQIVLTSSNTSLYYSVYDKDANGMDMYHMGSGIRCVVTDEAGVYYIQPEFRSGNMNGVVSASFTVTLQDNDDYEPNNSLAAAKPITAGQAVDILVNGEDEDWFSIDLKAGQFVTATMSQGNAYANICDGDGNQLDSYNQNGSRSIVAEEDGTYYIRCYNHSGLDMVGDTLTVTVAENDAYEFNGSVETAAELTVGETVNLILGQGDYDWFKITTTKPGQIITAAVQASEDVEIDIYDSTGKTELNGRNGTDYTVSAVTGEAGTYYIRCTAWNDTGLKNAALTVTLGDNDDCEPNAAKENAYELTSGKKAEFILAGSDEDWFAVTTTKDGQDIQVDISGFNYANKGRLDLTFDETIEIGYITGNNTWYFHAAEAGTHYIKLDSGQVRDESTNSYTSGVLNLAVTATVLEGDKHESGGSDSKENAVTLNLGTDETFQIGGWGDEDWFQFEVAPETGGSNLYTLQFLDLNPDYSDEFYYEVYAPDGTLVAGETLVSIHHSNILACDQQGMYQVRIYSRRNTSSSNSGFVDITRSDLRIRVSVGGNDPYENNDTWLEAKAIQTGQMIQHVLASSTDQDWFYFTAEQADMSFVLEFDQPTYYALYRAEDLAEFGTGAEAIASGNYSSSVRTYYYKLDGAGVYYVTLSTSTASASEELRSFTVTLEPHSGEENNDTWDKAKPLYETVPQEFDLAGYNDNDWFTFTVPEGAAKATLVLTKETSDGWLDYSVYRETDIINVGLNATPVVSSDFSGTSRTVAVDVSAGTYYVKTRAESSSYRYAGCTLTYYLSYDEGGSSMENAIDLEPGVWSQERSGTTWYRLGELKAGDVVRYNRDGSGVSVYVELYDSTGYCLDYTSYANDSFSISSDGEYYLEVSAYGPGESGKRYTSRIRYDIGSNEVKEITVSRENITVVDSAPTNLDPTAVNNGGTAWLWHVYEMPYQADGFGGDIVPVLADPSKGNFKPGMDHVAGSNEYILYIRKGIKDHAGNELKASDVVFSYDLLINSGNASDMSHYDTAEVVDDYTVKLTFKRELNLAGELAIYFARVFFVTEASYKASASGFIYDACGTGPYKLQSYTSGSGMTLVKNENYWCAPENMTNRIQQANVQSIRYVYASESAVVAMMLLAGEADAAANLSLATAADFQDGGQYADMYDTHVYWENLTSCLLPNCHPDSLTGDINMRLAIFYAISAGGVVDGLDADVPGSYRACYGMGNPSFPDYSDDWAAWENYQTVTDRAKVNEYLNKAGYNGQTVEIIARAGDTETIAVIIGGMLEAVGIKPHITLVDRTTHGLLKADPTAWHISVESLASSDYIVNLWDKLWKSNNDEGYIAQSGQFIKDDEFLQMCLESKTLEGHTQENVDAVQQYIIDNAYAMGLTQKGGILVCPTDVETVYLTDKNAFVPGAATYKGTVTQEIEYVTKIEGPGTITLKVGEERFVDLRLAPYTGLSGANHIYLDQNTNSTVATYNNYTGYVTAAALGSTEMTFEVWCNGKYLTKTVTVNVVEPVAATGVSITNAPEELELGSSAQLTAALTPGEATEDVVWSSSDTSVLYVTSDGKVVAVGEGEATVTAAVAAGSDSVSIKVTPAEATEDDITSLVLDKYSLTMYMNEETQKLTATVLPQGIGAEIKWVSSNTAAATVDQNGVITAVAPGLSIISASAGDHSASCIVTVQAARVRVTGISFAQESLQIPLGGQTTLVPTIEPYNATTKTLTWVSDDESVATVSRTGIVNALAVGVTTIRATTLDGGFVAEITIEVTAKAQLGDINGDGYVNSADALITLRVAVGLVTLTEEEAEAADVNKDGYVDAGDGVKILRFDARLIDSLE